MSSFFYAWVDWQISEGWWNWNNCEDALRQDTHTAPGSWMKSATQLKIERLWWVHSLRNKCGASRFEQHRVSRRLNLVETRLTWASIFVCYDSAQPIRSICVLTNVAQILVVATRKPRPAQSVCKPCRVRPRHIDRDFRTDVRIINPLKKRLRRDVCPTALQQKIGNPWLWITKVLTDILFWLNSATAPQSNASPLGLEWTFWTFSG